MIQTETTYRKLTLYLKKSLLSFLSLFQNSFPFLQSLSMMSHNTFELKLFVFLTAALVSSATLAQEIVLDNAPGELYNNLKGPGAKHYFHPYISFGLIPDIGELSGAKINPLLSNEYVFGVRYKRKIFSFYQAGLDISARFCQYRIEDEEGDPYLLNPLSDNWNEGKQNLRTNSLGLELYNRVRAGKGNNLGYYIDAGLRGEWNYMNKHVLRSKNDINNNPAGKVKIVSRKLDYMKKTALTVSGRIGFKKIIIYGSYRLSEVFSEDYTIPDMPKMIFGIQWVI